MNFDNSSKGKDFRCGATWSFVALGVAMLTDQI
jgi:hypothetical protein